MIDLRPVLEDPDRTESFDPSRPRSRLIWHERLDKPLPDGLMSVLAFRRCCRVHEILFRWSRRPAPEELSQAPASTPMDFLQGHLLIASSDLLDPNFAKTVVLVAAHGEEGAPG